MAKKDDPIKPEKLIKAVLDHVPNALEKAFEDAVTCKGGTYGNNSVLISGRPYVVESMLENRDEQSLPNELLKELAQRRTNMLEEAGIADEAIKKDYILNDINTALSATKDLHIE